MKLRFKDLETGDFSEKGWKIEAVRNREKLKRRIKENNINPHKTRKKEKFEK